VTNLPKLLTRKLDRTSEALDAIKEAEALVERFQGRVWSVELYRLRGVFLSAIGGDETKIQVSFHNAIKNCKGAEVGCTRETGESILHRIPQSKDERFGRT
jgi:hypothetical protein